jgi:hypothetical protein
LLVLTFRDLPAIKRTQYICHIIFREIEDHGEKKSTGDAMRRIIGPRASFQHNLGSHGFVLIGRWRNIEYTKLIRRLRG